MKMAESLAEQHPDVTRIVHRWGRAQHYVNYKPFQGNELILRSGQAFLSETDDYGLVLE